MENDGFGGLNFFTYLVKLFYSLWVNLFYNNLFTRPETYIGQKPALLSSADMFSV